jgi:hypothetical protein
MRPRARPSEANERYGASPKITILHIHNYKLLMIGDLAVGVLLMTDEHGVVRRSSPVQAEMLYRKAAASFGRRSVCRPKGREEIPHVATTRGLCPQPTA